MNGSKFFIVSSREPRNHFVRHVLSWPKVSFRLGRSLLVLILQPPAYCIKPLSVLVHVLIYFPIVIDFRQAVRMLLLGSTYNQHYPLTDSWKESVDEVYDYRWVW